jgi:hypothetical protein
MVNPIKLPDGKEIQIHELDVDSTIKDKIAIHYKINPRLIQKYKVQDEIPEIKTIYNVFDEYINSVNEKNKKKKEKLEPEFKTFYEFVNTKFDLTPTEFVQLWKGLWEGFKIPQLKSLSDANLNHDVEILKNLYPEFKLENNLLNVPFDFKLPPSIMTKTVAFDKNSSDLIAMKGVPTTHFEQTKQYITIALDNELNYPLLYLFDRIVLTDRIPFAIYDKYCKIYNNFTLNGMPPISDDHINLLYRRDTIIDYEPSSKDMWYKNYNVITVGINAENKITIEIGIETNIDMDNVLTKIESVLNWSYKLDKKNMTTNKISGEFYILHQNVSPVILKDVLLFHPVFKHVMYSNDVIVNTSLAKPVERNKYTTTIHYIQPGTSNIFIFNITTREVTKGDLVSPINIGGGIKIGEPITICNIKQAANIAAITRFQSLVSKLIAVYNNQEKEITKMYSKYLKDINNRKFVVRDDTLSSTVPDLFIDLYTVACPKPRNPTIISSDRYDEKDASMMKFPKEGDEHAYQCNTPAFPFIGLKDNTLENKEEYPYLPCCYKINQKSNKKSNYYKYFYEIEKNLAETNLNYIPLKTQKFAGFGVHGMLPKNIHELFGILDQDNEYYRKGMHYEGEANHYTFLECILEALNYNNIVKVTDIADRIKVMQHQKDELSTFVKNSGICKQECYNLTLEEISTNIKSSAYFDPELYIRAIEEFYNVNIILFTRNTRSEMNKLGNYLLPRHDESKGYIFPEYKNRETILIYEHTGGIYTKNKSCELIVRHDKSNITTMLFKSEDDIIKKIYKQWIQTFPIYEKNVQVVPISPPDIKNITAQYIDSYGKTRGLYYGNTRTFIYCMPIAPLNLPLVQDTKVTNTTSFASRYNLENLRAKNGFTFYDNDSAIDVYSTSSFLYNKRTSTHLIEYALYLYSTYLQTLGTVVSTAKSVSQFIKKYTKIVKTVEYKIGYLIESNPKVLELESKEVAKKLEYMLRVNLLNRRKDVLNYYKQNHLENYYNTIYDFQMYPNQYIYLFELLYRSNHTSKLYLFPPAEMPKSTCYIRYKGANYLAQPCKTIQEVTNRLYNWNTYKKNIYIPLAKKDKNEFICIPFIENEYSTPIQIGNGTHRVIYSNQHDVTYYMMLFENFSV